jgi:VIT1/CCC1 family predicted Fe2+/Mn2+ transporter
MVLKQHSIRRNQGQYNHPAKANHDETIHRERHLIDRIGWLRAAVLGANDGIVSTASLIVGVAAAATAKSEILIAGIAGLVAGAMAATAAIGAFFGAAL